MKIKPINKIFNNNNNKSKQNNKMLKRNKL